jgi:hypothetical protein
MYTTIYRQTPSSPATLLSELKVAGYPVFEVECHSNTMTRIIFDSEPTTSEMVGIDAIIAAHEGWRYILADQVDTETRRRIALGYEVIGLTRKSPSTPIALKFSLSTQAQLNIAGFDPVLVPEWPLYWDCADDSDALLLVDAAAVEAFRLAGKGAVALAVQTGRMVRRAVMDAATEAEASAACASYLAGN